MHIFLAQPRGFCAGVCRALDALTCVVAEHESPVYVYHEIVHNTWVVNDFKKRGVRFVESLSDVPTGSVLMFSAHGVAPAIRKEALQRNLMLIDATCPLVERVHQEVRRFAEKGYHIIYIGHSGHDEVIGTIGEAPENITLISRESEIADLHFAPEFPLACLMQTTLSVDETRAMLNQLKKRFPNIVIPKSGDICYATQNRQEAVRQLATKSDIALVVGSENSSNSRRLYELALTQNIPTFLIDGPDDIDLNWFAGHETVLMTAGASAPEQVVEACVNRLKEKFSADIEEKIIVLERKIVMLDPVVGRDGRHRPQ